MILSCGYCSETEDGWHVMIQDAILEKCIENGAGVVHIAVDKSSSEVYLKTADSSFKIRGPEWIALSTRPQLFEGWITLSIG